MFSVETITLKQSVTSFVKLRDQTPTRYITRLYLVTFQVCFTACKYRMTSDKVNISDLHCVLCCRDFLYIGACR
jgi:hypothetical protein